MTQPPPWPQQPDGPQPQQPQQMDGPQPQQQPAQQPPQQPQSPYDASRPGYGYPRGGQPVADNPYAQQAPRPQQAPPAQQVPQPQQPQQAPQSQPQQPSHAPHAPHVPQPSQPPQAQQYQPYQQPPPFPPPPQHASPYGGYPSPPPQGPQVPAPASGGGKRRAGLIAGGALVALVLVGGGVWFVLGDRGGDAKAPTAHGSPGVSETGPGVTDEPTAPEPPVAGPSAEGSAGEEPSLPDLPTPTGTGLQAVWRAPDSTMLALGDAYKDEPRRVNAVLSDGNGFECKGRWQKDDGGGLVVALLCEQDGTKAEDKDRLGEIEQSGDTLTVEWKKGTTGTESFERFRDMDPA
ncbi:hypothetical protein OG923_15195 [Streptomyces halstedii]|uniref:hypothetical protein n=1 Tax=Streptomyces halstedii TaxID=1944 RepID=UPI00324D88F7